MPTTEASIDLDDFVVVRSTYKAGEVDQFDLDFPPLETDYFTPLNRYVDGIYLHSTMLQDLGIKVRRTNYYFVIQGDLEYEWTNLETKESGCIGRLNGRVTAAENEEGVILTPLGVAMKRTYHSDSVLVCWVPKEAHAYLFKTYEPTTEGLQIDSSNGMLYCVEGSFTVGDKTVEKNQFTRVTAPTTIYSSNGAVVTWFGREDGN